MSFYTLSTFELFSSVDVIYGGADFHVNLGNDRKQSSLI